MKEGWQTTKSVGRFARKHPILTVSLLTVGIGSVNVTNAQTAADSLFKKSQFNHGTLAPPSAFPNQKINNFKPTTVKPKIIGSENFESIELKNGILYINGYRLENSKSTIRFELRAAKNELRSSIGADIDYFYPESLPIGVYRTRTEKQEVTFLIYESGIIQIGDNNYASFSWAPDKSKLFLNKDAICIAENGTMFVTTPTFLLAISPSSGYRWEYATLIEHGVPIKNPRFEKTPGAVDLGDPTFGDAQLRFALTDMSVSVVNKKLLGAR